jgi:ABC-type multidrug transport system ATPase subunit
MSRSVDGLSAKFFLFTEAMISHMNTPIIEINELSRRFGKLTAVDSISLDVRAHEVFGLLGSNGAGKTTTIKMLTTLLPPSPGDALIAGLSIKTQSIGVRRSIGYVPQAVSVDGWLTGYENVTVSTKDGVITLSGSVPHYAEKQAAERATQRVEGVKAIAEELEVNLTGIHKRPDEILIPLQHSNID